MKETTKKNKTKTKKTSSYVKKEIITQLSDEELLEQILKKNKEKKAKRKTYAKKTGVVKSTRVKKTVTSTIDDSLLLDEILKKNKAKKERAKKRKASKSRIIVDSNTVENKIVKQILDQEEKEKNLIITKEINLKEYLEEQKKLEQREDLKALDEELSPKEEPKHKVKFNYNKLLIAVMVFVLLFTGIVAVIVINKNGTSNALLVEEEQTYKELDNFKAIYNECMNEPVNENDNNEQMTSYTQELNNYLANYKVSVYYQDINRGFSYTYQGDKKYYAASLVKTIPVIYIYEKAINGEINLNDTITYSSRYNYSDSAFFDNVSFGTQVSLRDIVKYAIFYSDNSAYMMLIDYIGVSNLKNYAKELGINNYMDTDYFGHVNVLDVYIMFNKLNSVITDGGELGGELKYYFVNSDKNDLMLGEYSILAATKYGETPPFYHNAGIVYDSNPYIVVILTEEFNGDHEQKVRDISKKIYELHKEYYNNRIKYCNELGNKKSTE